MAPAKMGKSTVVAMLMGGAGAVGLKSADVPATEKGVAKATAGVRECGLDEFEHAAREGVDA